VLVVVGALDQTSGAMTPRYAAVAREWRSDDAWVADVESALPKDAAVLELPYVPFPSSPPVGRMVDYDHVRPYLHSDELRWSYGAMKGRPEDVGDDIDDQVRKASSYGYDAVMVDRFGFADNGAAVEARLRAIAKGAAIESPGRRRVLYVL
jgi:phosphoglycerol transferase